jgi:hypothetical protein
MAGQLLKLCTLLLIPHIIGGTDPLPGLASAKEPSSIPCSPGRSICPADCQNHLCLNHNGQNNSGNPQAGVSTIVVDPARYDKARDDQARVDQSVASVLPASTVVYLQINSPALLIDQLLNHPVRAKIESLEPVKDFYKSPQYSMVQIGETYIQWQLGDTWQNLLKSLTDQGACVAVDSKTSGIVYVVRSSDEAKLKKVAGAILGYIETNAKNAGKEIPFEKTKYRGHNAAKFEEFVIARIDNWFIVSSKEALAKSVADRIIDQDFAGGFAETSKFKSAWESNSSKSSAWAFADLEALRNAGVAKQLFTGKTNEPFVELIAGGILESLKTAPYATASIELDNRGIAFSLSSPFDPGDASAARAYFFGSDQAGQAPKPLVPENTIANIVAHRDVAQWWLSKESLFDESVIANLAQADSQLSTMFAGLDFGEEVLGATEPGVQVVVTEQTYSQEYQPDVKLPSFALVFRLKESELDIRRRFKVAYQSVLGLVNYGLAQQGNPQFEMATDKTDQGEIISATYLLEGEGRKGLINYNFSPSIAFSKDYFIISSTKQLADELGKLAENADPAATLPTNTSVRVNAAQLSEILKANRESFIAQNMIEKGHGRDAAEKEIMGLLMIADFFEKAQLDLKVNPDSIDLSARIDLK